MPDETPEPAVTVTLTEMYHEFRGLRDEVKHLSAVMDPALAQIRADVGENRSRMDVMKAERVAADNALETRIRSLETAGLVSGTRMWTVVGVLAAVIVAIIVVVTYLQQ